MKNPILLTYFAFLIIFNPSCKKSDPDLTNQIQADNYLNVAYGTDPLQKMDLYLPQGRSVSQTRLLVLIHGGGWSSGDKSDLTPFVDTMKRRLPDWAICNINYRLAAGNSNLFPTQENDVKMAISFIYSKLSDFKISDKWALLGASAGGHLSLLQAYKYASPVRFKAVVNFFGPSDMAALYTNPASSIALPSAVAMLLGGTPSSNPDLYFQSSPINFINAQSPPTLTLQGGADPLVSPSQQTTLHLKLSQNNVANQLKIYPGLGHGWTGADMTNSFDIAKSFLLQYVQ